jgi:uncharacterized protein YdaU (DUF1376 family)
MPVDLTRMDFHVVRFMESEDVEDMDACEIGQYCLLLFKAWSLAKDVTLPNDSSKLARYARVQEVSPKVMKKFPLVDTEWGLRHQNSVQLEVWRAARERSTSGKAAANARWNAGASEGAYAGGNAGASEGAYAGGNADSDAQTKPSKHTKQAYQAKQAGQAELSNSSLLEAYADKVS